MSTKEVENIVNFKTAGTLLGLSRQRLYQLIKAGEITVHYIVGHPCFRVNEIMALDRKRRVKKTTK